MFTKENKDKISKSVNLALEMADYTMKANRKEGEVFEIEFLKSDLVEGRYHAIVHAKGMDPMKFMANSEDIIDEALEFPL